MERTPLKHAQRSVCVMILNSHEVDNRNRHHKRQPLSLEAPLKSLREEDSGASCTVQSSSGLNEEGKRAQVPSGRERVLVSNPTAQASRWVSADGLQLPE